MNNASDNETVTQHTNNNKHVVHIKPKFEDCNMTTTGLLLSGGNNNNNNSNNSSSCSVVDNNNADETEWRRDWQPDLKCCPWKVLQADHYVYLVKANFLHDSYQFLITDLNHFWYESITHSEFLNRLQELNPNLEAPTTKILDHIKTNLEKNSSDNLSISKEESKSRLHLWINSDLAGFPFCWQMIGESAHEEMVSENTTIPLLMMVSELYRRQKALLRIIFEKDKEIENYKAQGCKLTKKNIATVPFDETVFEHSMVFSQEFEDNVKLLGTTAFESSGQELYQNIMTKYTWLHRCTKTEPGSANDDDSKVTVKSEETIQSTCLSGPSWTHRLPPSLSQQLEVSLPHQNPQNTPTKSPFSSASTSPQITEKEEAESRRKELQEKLALEEQKKEEKKKKKRKLAL